jgi:hypothetical protein
LEIRWFGARQLARVKIWHGGFLEKPDYTAARYRLHCLREHGDGAALDVRDNRQAIATHELACTRAIGLRIAWAVRPEADALIRVYEVEAWGR